MVLDYFPPPEWFLGTGENANEEQPCAGGAAFYWLFGNGCIIGRNTFQRPKEEALIMLGKIIDILRGERPGAAKAGD